MPTQKFKTGDRVTVMNGGKPERISTVKSVGKLGVNLSEGSRWRLDGTALSLFSIYHIKPTAKGDLATISRRLMVKEIQGFHNLWEQLAPGELATVVALIRQYHKKNS